MSVEKKQRLTIDVQHCPEDDSYFIAIEKNGTFYRLAAYYLTLDAAMTDLQFLLCKLAKFGFTKKGG